MKTLYSFDFDGTLFFTPLPEEGKEIWKNNTDTDWTHVGWWSKQESIDPNVFCIPKNEWVYRKYLEASNDNNGYKILATGRLNKVEKMRDNIYEILLNNNISFDEIMPIPQNGKYPINGEQGVYLNWGGSTLTFKIKLFEQLINEHKFDQLIMYDDRYEHIVEFVEWSKNMSIKITVVDIENKVEHKNY